MLTENSEILTTIILGGVLFLFLVIVIFISAIRYQKKQKTHLLEKQQLQSQFAETLLQSQLEIQEQTLQRVSWELHDNLGQVASIIKINLNTLNLADATAAAEKIEGTKDLTRQLIHDIKALSLSLGSERLKQTGLLRALETEIDRLNKTGQFTASLTLNGAMPDINDDTVVIIYRMSQEIMNNMIKHSGAKNIHIGLTVSKKVFTLAFADDGAGFDLKEKAENGGAGLKNLYSRAALINAVLSITTSQGKGTNISIQLTL
jgi:two-component system, NarL family, sensor kinase